jgi:PAS domain S-box-containing protein
MTDRATSTEDRFRTTARVLALSTCALGCLVLIGWAADIETIKRIVPGGTSMKANTAATFVLAGLSLWLRASVRESDAKFGTGFAVALLILAALTLSEDVFSFNLGIDQLLFIDDAPYDGGSAGRMSPASAVGFLLAGVALVLLAKPDGVLPDLGQALSLLGVTLALISVLGYIAGIPELYQIPPYSPLSLQTAIGFLLLHLGVFCACPAKGITAGLASASSGAFVARRLIPLAVVLPSTAGAILVSAAGAALISTAAALAISSILSGFLLILVIWWTADKVDQNERAADRQRRFFETTLAGIADGVLVADPQGRVTYMNAIAEGLTGWSSDEARGKSLQHVFEIIDETTRATVENPVNRVLKSHSVGGITNHTVLIAKDGTEWPIDDSAAPIFKEDGKLLGAVLVFRDITERRRQERALSVSEKLYRTTFESAPIGIAHTGLDGKWLQLNPAVCTITGYSNEELRQMSFADITHPDHLAAAREQARRLASGERESYSMEKRYIRKDGSIVWVRRSVSTLFDIHNAPLLFISVIEDISDRKRVEAQQQARVSELKKEARNKDLFLATLGHELRNPLAALASANELIARGLGDPELAHRMLATHTEQLIKLVNDLLDVARVSSGKIALNKEQVDLADVVTTAVEIVQSMLSAKMQTLAINMPKKLYVEADAGRIEQVITNLLVNASKYSDEGTPISLDLYQEDGQAVIRVEDKGIGLSAEQLEVIFEPFMQVSPGVGGLGIGLALAHNLLELHEGSIRAHSEGLGLGSRFEVRFPVGNVDVQPASDAEELAQHLPHSVRILIVDDAQGSAEALGLLLESVGGQVTCAFDGKTALEKAATWQPDVALIDIGLPDISGFDVVKQLRANGFADALLLAITGFGDPGSHEKISEAGFDERLVKPVNFELLVQRIQRYCEV